MEEGKLVSTVKVCGFLVKIYEHELEDAEGKCYSYALHSYDKNNHPAYVSEYPIYETDDYYYEFDSVEAAKNDAIDWVYDYLDDYTRSDVAKELSLLQEVVECLIERVNKRENDDIRYRL